jgi:hypothetical protein
VTNTPPTEPQGRTEPDAQSAPQGRVVPFRRRGSLLTFNRPQQQPSPVRDLERYERTGDEDDYRHRMIVNAMAAVVTILLIAGGIWIANSMAQMRKNQDCALSGNRNCNPPVDAQASKG